ncbi:O-antigen ligase family protein [Clostridium thermarum]|uniref:O-antigen ligase family protein n=1 Tax=Clostridium thermarum TaxID=1716543 RepID=UPI0013D2CCAA|nr:O-antigen ligase family protein [Clostridium thermarum]
MTILIKKRINVLLIILMVLLNFVLVYNETWNYWIPVYALLLVLVVIYFIAINIWEYLVNIVFIMCTSFLPMVVIQRHKDSYYYGKAQYFYLFSLILLLGWWFKMVKKGIKPRFNLIDKFLGAYGILIILSTIFSVDIIRALDGKPGRREGALVLLCYIFMMFIFSKYYEFKKIHLEVLFACTIIIVLYGFVQYYTKYDYLLGIDIAQVDLTRERSFAPSTFGHRNFYGSFITLVLPISMFCYLLKGGIRYFIYTLLIFGGLISCQTRGVWATFIIYFTFIVIYFLKRKKAGKRILLMALGFAMVFSLINFTTDNSVVSGRAQAFKNEFKAIQEKRYTALGNNRLQIWSKIPKLIMDKPLLGSGPDTFDLVFMKENHIFGGTVVDKAHNEILQKAVTEGIPATILYLIIVAYTLVAGFKQRKNTVVLVLLCTVTAYFVQAIFNISHVGIASTYWIMMGMIIKLTSKEETLEITSI